FQHQRPRHRRQRLLHHARVGPVRDAAPMSAALSPASLLALLLQPTAAVPAPYRVGPGDVIEIVVDGRPDLSRMPTVQTTGRIWLPRAGDVDVHGLTTGEIAARITPKLAGSDLAAPRVDVRVTGYYSQFVW